MSETGTSFFGKCSLLTWKNWQISWNNRVQMLLSLLTPSMFAVFLVLMRFSTKINHVEFVKHDTIQPEIQWRQTVEQIAKNHEKVAKHGVMMYSLYVPQLIVAYAPNNTMYSELMNLASSDYLNNIELKGFNTIAEMRNEIMKEHYFAGIGFSPDDNVNVNEQITAETANITLNLDFSLVFPSELRFFDETFIGQSWKTSELHNHEFLNTGEQSSFDLYVREGFISLQHAVSMAFIKSVVADKNLTRVGLRRFPRIQHKYDPFISKLKSSISLILLVGYLYPCMNLAKRMLREKEQNLTSLLSLLGISATINFLSWFIRGFTILISGSIFVLLILKINWTDGCGICSYSSWFTIYYFLVCYNIASVTFCFFICSTVSSMATGVVMVIFFWFLTYLPFTASRTMEEESIITKISLFCFSNTAMGIGFSEIIIYEERGVGLQWNNLFRKASPESMFSVGGLSAILIFVSIIYTFLGINMNRLKIVLDFLEEKLPINKCRKRTEHISTRSSIRSLINNRKSKIFAIENEDKKVIIELNNLTKIYGGTHVIHDVSMSVYEGEITVIMGHNGAGKTTLLSMVAGFVRPTSGHTLFDGVNLRKRSYYGLNMGVCFQHIFFPDLTVASNITFYSRLKGLKTAAVQKEVKKYLNAMNLKGISNVLACNLSNGLKQNLSICCALCGNSKYVILDEPSADMDAVARKRLWQLLILEKKNRTIIITTNSTEEAEVLGDRLGIMSGGLLMCFGSPFFLKTMYGRGYRLVCLKNPLCDTEMVTAFLRNHIPNMTPESEIGLELSYRISEGNSGVLPKLLLDLEESLNKLDISSCSITEPCVEDIFLRMGAEDPGEDNRFRQNEIMNGLTIYSEEYEKLNSMQHFESYKGLKLILSQVSAMLWKRYIHSIRRKATLVQYIMPAMVALLTFVLSESRDMRKPLRPITFRMTEFPESLTAVAVLRGEASELDVERSNLFKLYFENLPFLSIVHKVHILENRTFTDYTLEKQRKGLTFNNKHLVGASFDIYDDNLQYTLAWFNNYFLHTAPLSLNLAHNGILASRSHKGRITITHDPLPFTTSFDPSDVQVDSYAGNYLPINLTFITLVVYSSVLLFLINERATHFKLLQYICGMRNFSFWLGSSIYDFLRITAISLIVVVIILIFEHSSYGQCLTAIGYFLLLLFFGVCMTPFYYLVSLFFQDNSTGFTFIAFFNIYGVVGFCAVVESLGQTNINHMRLPLGYALLSHLVPYYSLCSALTKLFCYEKIHGICSIDEITNVSILVDNCATEPNCCVAPNLFTWNYLGILPEITYFCVVWLLCLLLLIVYHNQKWLKLRLGFSIPTDNTNLAFEDFELKHAPSTTFQEELISETFRVQTLNPASYRNKPLVMSNVSKIYGEKVAVNRMTLLLERCECFGLLGVNGAGKSTVLNMLVGDEQMTCGRVHVDGISLITDIKRMYKRIGYCPYSQSMPINMTCHELLTFFCRLRGIKIKHIEEVTQCLVKVLGIIRQYDRQLIYVSSGLRRRLSTAIALIGNPSIVYLDGHSVNIDPAGRRQIWNIICRMCALGKTVMLTTHNAIECERFCTRFCVINKGKMLCLDTIYNLQNKYIQGYVLQVKVKLSSKQKRSQGLRGSQQESQSVTLSNPYLKVMSFVENEFPNSTVRDQSGAMITFLIPLEGISISIIFKKIQRNAFLLNIENFSVTRETLSLLFSDLVEAKSASSTITLVSPERHN